MCRILNPSLSDCQAGFRYGADEQAWVLFETLRLRKRLPCRQRRTFAAFVDIRKAFDTVWRDGLLHKLWRKGVTGRVWTICAALLSTTRSSARVGGRLTSSWGEVAGARQGAILSPLEFNVFIDDLVDAVSGAFPGVAVGVDAAAPRVHLLLYADDSDSGGLGA